MAIDESQQEGVDVDALDKTLEKLTKAFDKLDKNLEKYNQTASNNNKTSRVDHDKIHKQNMERQASYFENVKAMKLLSKEMKQGKDSFAMFTGLLTKSVTLGYVFKKIEKHVDGYISASDRLRDATQQLAELEENVAKKQGVTNTEDIDWTKAGTDRNKRTDLLETQSQAKEQGGEKGLGGKLSGAKEFFGKHKMGMLIGAGSAGVLIGIFKKALDVSPMFQAIKKLLNFGIMMVLRPIGDFFGFLLRPIMVWMLRKLIIPFYQTYLPVAQQMGTDVGNFVVGFFEWVSSLFSFQNKKTKEITSQIHADSSISAIKDMDGNMIKSQSDMQKHITSISNKQIKAFLDRTTNSKNTIGNWQSKRTEIFGDRADEVRGYNIAGVGQNIPLNKAGADWYKKMGADVQPVMGQSNLGGNANDRDTRYGNSAGLTVNVVVEGSVIAERELEKTIVEEVEKYNRRYQQ